MVFPVAGSGGARKGAVKREVARLGTFTRKVSKQWEQNNIQPVRFQVLTAASMKIEPSGK
jgi:hypothetical protein